MGGGWPTAHPLHPLLASCDPVVIESPTALSADRLPDRACVVRIPVPRELFAVILEGIQRFGVPVVLVQGG